LHGNENPFSMWKTLIDLFYSNNDANKLAFRDKHRSIWMQKNETIPQYLSRFTQVQDELGGVGENVPSSKLVI